MPSVNFELRDLPFQPIGSSMSVKELSAADGPQMVAALQRTFLHQCDVLRKCNVPTENVIGALLGAAIQEYIDHAIMPLIEKEREANPNSPASLSVLADFMTALGKMMVNQGMSAGVLGLAMLNSGLVLAKKDLGVDVVIESVEGSLRALIQRP